MQRCGQLKLTRPLYQWNLMLRSSTEDGFFTETLKIYSSMAKSGVHGSNFTFPPVLKSCAKLCFIREGEMVHSSVLRMGFQADVFVQTALIDMYSKCSDLVSSHKVFDEMPVRSLVSWNSMISACCRHSRVNESFGLLKQMQFLGFEPSSATFVSIVSCCSLGQGLSIHSYAIKLGLHSELPLSNSLMSMYVHLGQVKDARSIFNLMCERSIISWTTILGGYVTVGDVAQVFDMFNQMRQVSVSLDHIVFLNLVSGCVQLRNLLLASSVYCVILKSGCDCEDPIDNLLVTMFSKCGDLVSARKIFDMVHEKNVLVWTSLISGYTHFGKPHEAVELFKKLLGTTVRPNEITVATVLSACADIGSLSMGEEIEEYILRSGLQSDLRIQTSLIHMFCKCGSIKRAKEVFERVSEKDLAVWSSMINGYAIHGMGEEALSLFHKMQLEEEIKPDAMMYTSVLLACNHSGLVEDGLQHFESMQREFGIEPSIEHYLCMVDLLGRAGCLDLAMKTIQEMPAEVQPRVWAPFLSACRTHKNMELGEFAAQKLLDMKSASTGSYVLMSNFYTSVGKWKEAAVTRRLINELGLVKEPGWSQIEVNGSFHVFIAGDRSHHRSVDIYAKLEELNIKLMEAGYIAETDLVVQDLEKEEKVEALKVHSERLAIAFGLINTEAGATLTIIKNLRTCDDCHTALKFISKITCRHLIVRDGQRFHHFESGLCSCKDYW
ncbi:pentatricopeptide repeat-containing protein At4g33990-like [Cornus florida]|uniref:pentatricopeptide repeat-containing protein At4g33990-like n=1 Tax=Cornus florida TaxID=4283 RepID=UPI00289C5F8E|nr:pentatricopeptide repeat-containing protein At4g33990-like [Cornus florida]